MGLSSLYANVIMATLFLVCVTTLMVSYSDYMKETGIEVKENTNRLKEKLDTSIRITNVTTFGGDVIFLVLNDGKAPVEYNCTDFYIDRQYQNPAQYMEFRLIDNTFGAGVWDPGESLRMKVQYDINDKLPHEGRVSTCNGVVASKIFYKT